MAELKVYLPSELDIRFRKAAMAVFGYGRGSLSRAAIEAFAFWCAEKEVASAQPTRIEHEENISKQNELATEMKPDKSPPSETGAAVSHESISVVSTGSSTGAQHDSDL